MKFYELSHIGEFHVNHNEDFLVSEEAGISRKLIAVMDGWSSGTDSHFASTLIDKLLRKIAKQKAYEEYAKNETKDLKKTAVLILILTFISYLLIGQKYSLTIDSLTKTYIGKLSKDKQIKFDSLLKQRQSVDFFKRIDTITFDYAFIEESFCYSDTSGKVTEIYFLGQDTIPKSIYINGSFSDPKKIHDGFFIWYSKNVTYNYTLHPLFDKYSKLKPTQELSYEQRQIWSHGCITYENSKAIFEKRRSQELKSTYQILSMINKADHRIIVSVQFAPKRPKFKTHSYNEVWDW